jgi:CRISPR system Cascade subunit CasC
MTTFLQLHLLTAYPPANLNRDDNGQPKTAVFGGAQRLRISSQSLKRAWRTSAIFENQFDQMLAKRTQKIGRLVCDELIAGDMQEANAIAISRAVAAVAGKPTTDKNKDQTLTGQLVFLTPKEIGKFKDFAQRILSDERLKSELEGYGGDVEEEADAELSEEDNQAKKKSGKKKGISKKRLEELRKELLIKTDTAVDLAMFGRMLADSVQYNVEAAVQVAHAISTHRVILEDDYYTAVDDLKTAANSEDAGTSFIGVQEFAAGVFYLYICADLDLLLRNLGGDVAVARAAVGALIEAAATVAPRGKQNSFASRALASFVLAEAGADQPRSLAAAFLQPVKVEDEDLAAFSAHRLVNFRKKLADAYGDAATATRLMDATGEKTQGTLADVVAFAQEKVPAL